MRHPLSKRTPHSGLYSLFAFFSFLSYNTGLLSWVSRKVSHRTQSLIAFLANRPLQTVNLPIRPYAKFPNFHKSNRPQYIYSTTAFSKFSIWKNASTYRQCGDNFSLQILGGILCKQETHSDLIPSVGLYVC